MKKKHKRFLALLMAFALVLQFSISASFLSAYAEDEVNKDEGKQTESVAPESKVEKPDPAPAPTPAPDPAPAPENKTEKSVSESTPEPKTAKSEAVPANGEKKDMTEQDSNPDGKDDTDGNEGNGTVEEQGSDSAVNIPEETSGESLAGGAASSSDGTAKKSGDITDESGDNEAAAKASVDVASAEKGAEEKVTIQWADENGEILYEEEVKKGDMPSYKGETPTKDPDENATYTFAGWTPDVTVAEEDIIYKATFEASAIVADTTAEEVAPSIAVQQNEMLLNTMQFKAALVNLLGAENDAGTNDEEYVSIQTTEASSNNDKTKAVKAWRDSGFNYYIAVAAWDHKNKVDEEFRNSLLEKIRENVIADAKFIMNNEPLIVITEDGGKYEQQPAGIIGKAGTGQEHNCLWVVIKMTPEQFENASDAEGENYIVEVPFLTHAQGFALGEVTINAEKINPTYTVSFNTDGGIPKIDSQSVHLGENATEPANSPTKEGYTFIDWFEQIGDTIADLAADAFDFTTPITKDTVLVAKWNPIPTHTVTYTFTGDVPAGVSPPEPKQYKVGETVPTAATPATVEGYTFEGWQGEVETMPDNDVTVTGNWIKNPEPTPEPEPEPTPPTPEPEPEPEPEPTPAPAPNPGDGGNPGGGPAAAPAAPAAAIAPAAVIANEPVPQAEPEPEEIIDEPAPLAAPEGTWALMNLIAAALSTVGAGVALFRKKEDDDEEDETDPDDEDDNRGRNMAIAKALGAAAAVASIATFILTEDMSLPMAMTDKWTLLMAALFAGQVGTAVANKKASESDYEDDEEAGADA